MDEKRIMESEEAPELVGTLLAKVKELEAENAALKEERHAAQVQALLREGALDAEYILEKLGEAAGCTGAKGYVEKAKKRFPALFQRKISGVKPAADAEEKAAGALGYSDRQALFQTRPDEYRKTYRRK